MADGYKSFDELYKAVIGNESPKKKATVDEIKRWR